MFWLVWLPNTLKTRYNQTTTASSAEKALLQRSDYFWRLPDRLEDQNLFNDWDYFASGIQSLKVHVATHGWPPIWDALLCGGRPELANPQSVSYTWLLPLYLLVPANLALFMQWAVLTAMGFYFSYQLFAKWSQDKFDASVAATIYCFNGYFASHYYAGHVTFSFFHLVPGLLLGAENVFTGKNPVRNLLLIALLTFGMVTTGPQAVIYFYPMFLLYLLVRLALGTQTKAVKIWRNLALIFSYHLMGLFLSAYKIVPTVAWMMNHPRKLAGSEMLPIYRQFLLSRLTERHTEIAAVLVAFVLGNLAAVGAHLFLDAVLTDVATPTPS